ncbi:MAG: hypothetical protein QW450_03475 [Candidatus Nitrosocaldus sp.]
MIEALIAAALAGVVTTLTRAMRREKGRDGRDEVYYGSTLSNDAGVVNSTTQGYVEDDEKGRAMVYKGIEHRIRSIADIRLKEYLNDGRISEEEYRELTGYSTNNKEVNHGYTLHTRYGVDQHDENGSRIRKRIGSEIGSNSMMMQEILLRLDRLNSRLDSLECKVDANRIGSLYIATPSSSLPSMPKVVHDNRKRSSSVKRRGISRESDDGSVSNVRIVNGEGREDKKVHDHDEGLEVMVIDDRGSDSIKGSMMKEIRDVSYEPVHMMEHDDGRRDDNNTSSSNSSSNSSNSNSIIAAGAGSIKYDSSNDELESIKKQIMDVLARLEKDV